MLRRLIHALRGGADPASGAPPASRHDVLGVTVVVINSREDVRTEDVLARAHAVLALMQRHAPARWHHFRRDVDHILVQRYPCRGAYIPDRRACLLELTFMVNREFNEAQVCATLVHESMHARIDAMARRFGWALPRGADARAERLCRRAELDFGRAVPNGAPVVERALASLRLSDAEVAPVIDAVSARQAIERVDRDARRPR